MKQERIFVMKRVLTLIVCLCMLAGTALLFASCGGASVNFGEYKVVYATDVSEYSRNKAKELSNAIKAMVGPRPKTRA